MNIRNAALFGVIGVMALGGCKKTADNKTNYSAAIDQYYAGHPACLWTEAKKFPVQVGHDSDDTAKYDALVDQGLLTRTTSEKKIIIISKQQNNYDVSDKGRSAWTADPSMPGYGNFCYGHRKVSNVVSATPASDQPGATTTVQYQYTLDGVPVWAKAAETQNTYPSVAANLAGPKNGTATLTNTQNGWQVTSTQ
ncbi:MAG: hypothetical protein JSS87_01785 [Acidobacteria bacterium]|nr:hypothetical protein [Acidobacteriota bacterium]